MAGRVAEAVPLLTQAMAQSTATDAALYETFCRLSLGEAHLLAGLLEEAHTLAKHTLVHARERQERSHEAYALRLLGEIAARREPPKSERAEAHYGQA
jgi:tetratricopeptide (TPR) repeat protein